MLKLLLGAVYMVSSNSALSFLTNLYPLSHRRVLWSVDVRNGHILTNQTAKLSFYGPGCSSAASFSHAGNFLDLHGSSSGIRLLRTLATRPLMIQQTQTENSTFFYMIKAGRE